MTDEEQEVLEGAETVEDQFAAADAAGDPEGAETPSIEEIAGRMGWVPKEKFRGEETKWKPADQFILDGKDIQERQSRELRNIRDTVETIKATTASVLQERLAEQAADLSARYASAVEKGDPDETWAAANELMRLRESAAPRRAAPAPETNEWVQKNSRVMNDPLAAQRALQVCDAYARVGQSTVEQLQNTEAVMRREFPHLFEDKAAPSVNAPNSRSTAATAKTGKSAADLPREARAVADDLVDRGLIKSADDYARNYFAAQAKRG